jgi:ribokinase
VSDGRLRLPDPRRAIEDLRFVVVGAYVTDCFIRAPRMPVWGEEYEARSVRTLPGGKALNQAVALARIGARVTAVGVVGDDGVGRDILAALTGEGVDVSGVQSRAGVSSALCVCFVGDNGENSNVWHIDDDVAVRPDTVRAAAAAIQQADAVLITFEAPAESVREAINAASESGAMVLVQPAPPLADLAGALSLPWELVDVVVPNESEARALVKGSQGASGLPADGPMADRLAEALASDLGVPMVVVTLGESGCVTHVDGITRRYPIEKVAAVDVTGAGDAFMAAFAAGLVSGTPVPEAVQAAQSAAARAVLRPGGYESMPSTC